MDLQTASGQSSSGATGLPHGILFYKSDMRFRFHTACTLSGRYPGAKSGQLGFVRAEVGYDLGPRGRQDPRGLAALPYPNQTTVQEDGHRRWMGRVSKAPGLVATALSAARSLRRKAGDMVHSSGFTLRRATDQPSSASFGI